MLPTNLEHTFMQVVHTAKQDSSMVVTHHELAAQIGQCLEGNMPVTQVMMAIGLATSDTGASEHAKKNLQAALKLMDQNRRFDPFREKIQTIKDTFGQDEGGKPVALTL